MATSKYWVQMKTPVGRKTGWKKVTKKEVKILKKFGFTPLTSLRKKKP